MFDKGASSWSLFDSMKIDHNLELYKLCHKYNDFPYALLTKLKSNPGNEMELREKIKGYATNNDDEIIKYIETNI